MSPPTTPFTPLHELPSGGEEDFLYHLYRGSDLLQDGRVPEAKEALEKALEFQPKDAKGQDLLAIVYYRLGVYDRAIEIYRRLVVEYPREPVLRVNLAVVLLKTGQSEASLVELRAALEIQPDHQKAHSYLGLVCERLGDHARAKAAYLRAGLVHMARRVGALADAGATGRSLDEIEREQTRRRDLRSVADRAFQEIESEENPFLVEAERAVSPVTTTWYAVEPGGEPARRVVPPEGTPVSPRSPPAPTRAGRIPDLVVPEGGCLEVDPGGALVVRVHGATYARIHPLLLYEGALEFAPVHRRSKGREREELFGEGDATIHRLTGTGRIVLAAAGARHYVVELDEETSYFREDLVVAFGDDLSWESGRVAAPESGTMWLASFRGRGAVALCVDGEVRRLAVGPTEGVTVEPRAIVGWVGRLLPRPVARPGTSDPGHLRLAGEGSLLFVLS